MQVLALFNALIHILKKIKINQVGNTAVVVPMIMSILMGTAVFSSDAVDDILAETRDTRRAADAYQITVALAQYYDDNQQYPIINNQVGSWDILEDKLVPEYVQIMPADPSSSEGIDYAYTSNGQKAIVYYTSEVEDVQKERWSY